MGKTMSRYYKQYVHRCAEGCPYFGYRPMDTSMWGLCERLGKIIMVEEIINRDFPERCSLEDETCQK